MNYIKLKEKQENEFNDFTAKFMFFAFSDEQLKEGLEKIGATVKDIYSCGAGGFVLKSKSKELHGLMGKFSKQLEECMKDEEFAYDAFRYELANHEYVYSQSDREVLELFDLWDDGLKDKSYLEVYNRAVDDYLNSVEA